jgi:hypothetical protein
MIFISFCLQASELNDILNFVKKNYDFVIRKIKGAALYGTLDAPFWSINSHLLSKILKITLTRSSENNLSPTFQSFSMLK